VIFLRTYIPSFYVYTLSLSILMSGTNLLAVVFLDLTTDLMSLD